MIVAGADEAGRGPIAGPVVAASVVLTRPQARVLLAAGMNDSKKMTQRARERVFDLFGELGVVWAAQGISPQTIDRINILEASLLAMAMSVEKIIARGTSPDLLIVDGSQTLRGDRPFAQRAIPKADAKVPCVMAASVAAKVIRDRAMARLDELMPGYGFAKHKGYPTAMHRAAVDMLGPSPAHRLSFGGYSKEVVASWP